MPLPPNVVEIEVDTLADTDFDCVLYQWTKHYEHDRRALLTDKQRKLPRLYVEHDPPMSHPTNARHPASDDPDMWIYHVSHYNHLMWDCGDAHSSVIEHGVTVPNPAEWNGMIAAALVAINNLSDRGRRLGDDLFSHLASSIPVRLVGLNAETHPAAYQPTAVAPFGPIDGPELPRVMADYRVFLNPIRYTGVGLALLEAMLVGLPPVALPTTELGTVITHGQTGLLGWDGASLRNHVQSLLDDYDRAQRLGSAASAYVADRFNIERFAADWVAAFERAAS